MTAPAADPNELRALAGAAAAADAPTAPPKPAPGPKVQAGTDPGAAPFAPELAPAPGPPTGEVLGKMLFPAFMALAPNWSVSMDEARALGDAWGGVLDHYYPGGLSQLGPWGAAILTTAAVIGPRVAMRVPPRRPAPKPEKEEKPAPTPDVAPQQPEAPAANDPTDDGIPRATTKYD